MINKLNRVKRITSLLLMLAIAGCQQSPSPHKQTAVSLSDQLEQTASLVAATQYLKSACNRSDLPDEQVILHVATRVAIEKGWRSITREGIHKHSDIISERLNRDSTPEQIKCSEFNRLLSPFISELQAESHK
ncbi:type II secretion system pilot lipoprotein GspS [Citrobacter sp. A316]|uniref:type II secretion system pilot lipoprotein GspS n=1 Tax=Citrobacter sp. A316 TaxID=1639132 RepID=UPI0009AF1773|nr:type II secretion system pilot lipoprotein GspS [Citrobacter sp. A316]OPW90946.1 chaperone lipoprotein [Citrobacter sp. A316]